MRYAYGLSSYCSISQLEIQFSGRTVGRRWRSMGLKGSKATEDEMERDEVAQLVMDYMSEDPSGRFGQNSVKQMIALNTGIHLKR